MKKILVMGGSGFLGSHVADALTESGFDVTIFDLKKSPYLRSSDGQKMIVGNLLNQEDVDAAIKGMDYVYHLAGISDIEECLNNPVDTVKMNILGTAYVVEACVKHRIANLIFASSAYVYSSSGSFYRISKQASELLIEGYHENFGLNYVIVRYGSLYGPRSDKRNTIFRLLSEAIENKKIVYKGSGKEKREFIHVFDAAKLSVEILKSDYQNQHIILTGPSSIQYAELLEMINEILGSKIELQYEAKESVAHYNLSPYSFNPKMGKKLITTTQVDLGQGLLSLLGEIHSEKFGAYKEQYGLLIK